MNESQLRVSSPELTGYLHPLYAESLSEFGSPYELRRSVARVLTRNIPGTTYADAMGCYPLFSCLKWDQLEQDLREQEDELVSLAVVTDPFGDYEPALLQACFPHLVKPYKEHFIVDFAKVDQQKISSSHRRYARKATKEVTVVVSPEPPRDIDIWLALYDNLSMKHSIKGMRRFSRDAFVKQLEVPGTVVLKALSREVVVGMTIWYIMGDRAYYHLGAFSQQGYELRASYALFWFAMQYFREHVARLDLGAGAGLVNQGLDGLSQFKRGWCTGTQQAYFCGRILDPEKYAQLLRSNATPPTDYFPAYRAGEFE